MNIGVLQELAKGSLRAIVPTSWDTKGKKDFQSEATRIYQDITDKELDIAWGEAILDAKQTMKKEYAEYINNSDFAVPDGALQWEDVKLIRGVQDGENFTLEFLCGEKNATIECGAKELMEPSVIHSKLQIYTLQDIVCPYLGKTKKNKWWGSVVLPWLKSSTVEKTERELVGDTVRDIVFEYMQNPISDESSPNAFKQTRIPVKSGGNVYINFGGCLEFIRKRTDKDIANKRLANVLKQMGGVSVKKGTGNDQLRFFKMPYENDETTEAGRGQNNSPRQPGEDSAGSGWDGLVIDVRERECEGHALEDGADVQRTSTEMQNNDNSCSMFRSDGGTEGTEHDAIPF